MAGDEAEDNDDELVVTTTTTMAAAAVPTPAIVAPGNTTAADVAGRGEPSKQGERRGHRAARSRPRRRRRPVDVDAWVTSLRESEPEELSEHCAEYRGCVSATWMGLQFCIFDGGLRSEQAKSFPFPQREELASVVYASNLLKSRPHSLNVVVRDSSHRAEVEDGSGAECAGSGVQRARPSWRRVPGSEGCRHVYATP